MMSHDQELEYDKTLIDKPMSSLTIEEKTLLLKHGYHYRFILLIIGTILIFVGIPYIFFVHLIELIL